MIRSERIAKRIAEEIKKWQKSRTRLVVAIDGYAGSGKTTVGSFIEKYDRDALSIHLDDFINHWKVRKERIEGTKDKPKIFEYHWYRYDELERLIKAFRQGKKSISLQLYNFEKNDFGPMQKFDLNKKTLVIDGIFLFHPRHKVNKFFDKKIYLDADFAKTDKKRIAREKKRWGKKYLPETHPDNWTKYFKTAYRKYVRKYRPAKRADLTYKI